jgi:hypothetical protein
VYLRIAFKGIHEYTSSRLFGSSLKEECKSADDDRSKGSGEEGSSDSSGGGGGGGGGRGESTSKGNLTTDDSREIFSGVHIDVPAL